MPDPSSPSASAGPADAAAPAAGEQRPLATGPGRVLVAVYAVFALAATSRAAVQILTDFHDAPLAYLLSAFSAVVYVIATFALARRGSGARRVAVVAVSVELAGVLAVGTASLLAPDDFPRATVWSGYGSGYGFVPLVLPVLGLWWLHRRGRPVDDSARSV